MKKRSGSFGPSLIELIVAVAVFALISALCVRIFFHSAQLAERSRELSRSVALAQSAAESFKATGDSAETAELLGGFATESGFTAYFDEEASAAPADAEYIVTGTVRISGSLHLCDISVSSFEGDELFSLTAAGRGAGQ